MTEKRRAGTKNNCPSYRGVSLIEVSVKRELTVVPQALSVNSLVWCGEMPSLSITKVASTIRTAAKITTAWVFILPRLQKNHSE